MSAALLTCKDLQPGVYYRVVDPGDADPEFKGAVVLGLARHIRFCCQEPAWAVTVWHPDPEVLSWWAGALWYAYSDADARFEVYEEAYVKT